jgi:TonB family protein
MLLAAPAMAHAADPWTPTSPWTLEISPTECSMKREFASGSSHLSLSLVRGVLGQHRILITMPPALHDQIGGKAAISAPGLPSATDGVVQGLTSAGAWLIAAPIDRASFGQLLLTRELTIDGDRTSLAIALGGAPNVAEAVGKCVEDHLRAWKIDPAEVDNDLHPDPNSPKPAAASWITNDDYPRAALRARQQGEVFMIWRVETDGHIKDCRVIQSSGSDALDVAACDIVRKRGRYRPMLDRDGHPAVMWTSTRFRWTLPR